MADHDCYGNDAPGYNGGPTKDIRLYGFLSKQNDGPVGGRTNSILEAPQRIRLGMEACWAVSINVGTSA